MAGIGDGIDRESVGLQGRMGANQVIWQPMGFRLAKLATLKVLPIRISNRFRPHGIVMDVESAQLFER
ncbi:MAG: hypothetical protein ACSHX9_00255 [Luteolibacter sp.]